MGDDRALVEEATADVKTCPDCAEIVRENARVCRHCGYRFDTGTSGARSGGPSDGTPPPKSAPGAAILSFVIPGLGHFYLGEGWRGGVLLASFVVVTIAALVTGTIGLGGSSGSSARSTPSAGRGNSTEPDIVARSARRFGSSSLCRSRWRRRVWWSTRFVPGMLQRGNSRRSNGSSKRSRGLNAISSAMSNNSWRASSVSNSLSLSSRPMRIACSSRS